MAPVTKGFSPSPCRQIFHMSCSESFFSIYDLLTVNPTMLCGATQFLDKQAVSPYGRESLSVCVYGQKQKKVYK